MTYRKCGSKVDMCAITEEVKSDFVPVKFDDEQMVSVTIKLTRERYNTVFNQATRYEESVESYIEDMIEEVF